MEKFRIVELYNTLSLKELRDFQSTLSSCLDAGGLSVGNPLTLRWIELKVFSVGFDGLNSIEKNRII
jgi:hypothetical protein